jgi:transposase
VGREHAVTKIPVRLAAWLGLTPLQKSTGGKEKLGRITKMGERTLRRLLVIGASAVIKQALLRPLEYVLR